MSSAPSLEIQAQRLEGFQPGDRVIVRGIVSSYESIGANVLRKAIARARLEARTAEAELLERYGETYEA